MLRTLIPLLVSALVTLELCVVFGMPLNFANIIALPLMLGVGVAFKIYFVMAWRNGQTGLLQSSLTHAVMFSAATTATAFGSLWLSHHPGTSSMGRLLALSLFCTLIGAVVFQPVLMGKPRAASRIERKARNHEMKMRTTAAGRCSSQALLAGCATGPDRKPGDPLEPMNRADLQVQRRARPDVAQPVAQGYQKVTPQPLRRPSATSFRISATWAMPRTTCCS